MKPVIVKHPENLRKVLNEIKKAKAVKLNMLMTFMDAQAKDPYSEYRSLRAIRAFFKNFKNDCGSAGCISGWCQVAFPETFDPSVDGRSKTIEVVFGVSPEVARCLYLGEWTKKDEKYNPYRSVTSIRKTEVLGVLRALLENRVLLDESWYEGNNLVIV